MTRSWGLVSMVFLVLASCTGPDAFDEFAGQGEVRTRVLVMGHETEVTPTVGLVDLNLTDDARRPIAR